MLKIETTSDGNMNPLEVFLFKGRYMLNTPSATYSFEDLYGSFGKVFRNADIPYRELKSVLVLGLGLGSIPYLLQKKYLVTCIIDCVEIDKKIIQLAKKYYPDKVGFSLLDIHHDDALEWIKYNNKKFDLISVDIFNDIYVPYKFHSPDFLLSLKDSAGTNGIILFSRLTGNKMREEILWTNLKKIFSNAVDIETGGNTILCWKNES